MNRFNPASLCRASCETQDTPKVSAQTASMSLHAAPVDAQDGGDFTQCPICGDHHEPGEISRECETGDGI
jgi:hypothetical protein